MKKRVVVLISGNGSNLQAIIDSKIKDMDIVLVLSNRRNAYGLERARNSNIHSEVFPLKPFKDSGKTRIDYDIELASIIKHYSPNLIVLAGWMHILSKEFLLEFVNIPIINLHPALPGQFDGANAIERAFTSFKNGTIKSTGVMVHSVIPEVDRGQVILQKEVEILPSDSLNDLKNRIHNIEHVLIVDAIKLILSN